MKKLILAAILALTTISVQADVGDIRLTTIHYSYHRDRDAGYNELHNGLGLEYEFSKDWHVGYIYYVNSQLGLSNGLTVTREWKVSENWDLGFMLGIADGYRETNWVRETATFITEDRNQLLGGLVIQRIPFRVVVSLEVAIFGLVIEF